MREYIAARLAEMKNPEERAALKEIMSEVFIPLYDETEAKYAALEKRVRDELPLLYDEYAVCVTVLPRSQAFGGHAYLSPVLADENESAAINFKELAETLENGGQSVIETVFYEADYLKCRRLEWDGRALDGVLDYQGETYPFKYVLKPVKRYSARIETLYSAFLYNDTPWTTINGAYFNKFFDVCLTEFVRTPPVGALITPRRINLDFGPYKDFIRRGLVPVWNVDIYHCKGEDFPMPAIDAVNYEYNFELSQLGHGCGFLVCYDNTFILHTRRERDVLVVTSPQPKGLVWDMYRIRRRQDTPVDIYPYPVLSNARKDSFSTRLMNKFKTRIATKAEMRKLVDSFEASEYMELTGFHFTGEQKQGESYDLNPFIRDEVRDPAYQKTLTLTFKAQKRDFFLNRDVLSFLVSEFQSAYPEYRCAGVLM